MHRFAQLLLWGYSSVHGVWHEHNEDREEVGGLPPRMKTWRQWHRPLGHRPEFSALGLGAASCGAGSPISRSFGGAPVKEFASFIRAQYANQYPVLFLLLDEHKTSQGCSACWAGELEADDGAYARKRCPGCGARWHRDVNAARNLLAVLLCREFGFDRPATLARRAGPPP